MLLNIEKAALKTPCEALEHAFAEYVDDFRKAGEAKHKRHIGIDHEGFLALLQKIENESSDAVTSKGLVPSTTFWCVLPPMTILGTIRIRHSLTDELRIEGGNIGYDVAPKYRNRGVATHMLSASIEIARRTLGLGTILITCDADNMASRRVIEKNGGIQVSSGISADRGVKILRFEIRQAEKAST